VTKKKSLGKMKKGDPPRNPMVNDPEYMKKLAQMPRGPRNKNKARAKAGLVTTADLLEEQGYKDPEKAPAEIRLLAEKAVLGTTSDMQLFLRQSQKLQASPKAQEIKEPDGRCPHCGEDMGRGPLEYVLADNSLEGLRIARMLALEDALRTLDPEHELLTGAIA